MSRTTIDDKANTDIALKAAVDREKRREFADWLKSGGLPELNPTSTPSEGQSRFR
ncbi:hypothetical protein AB0L22_17055 [Micromonospora haikouensis]|uniref:hypothetical protein n=1 Tax=Micromonospora haikouensis TaxID=686309 RepID=UPI00344492B2